MDNSKNKRLIPQWLAAYIPHNRRSILCACFAAFLGVGITILAEQTWLSTSPHNVSVDTIAIRSVPIDGVPRPTRWLDVVLKGAPSQKCLRITQHLIYRNIPSVDPKNSTPTRQYFPLGSALNGARFSSSVLEIEVSLRLPYGLPSGEWWYVNRSSYICTVWPGFERQTEYETKPILVTILEDSPKRNSND